MYEVIGSRASRAFRVLWMLEELGLHYVHLPVAPHSSEARAANPSGKIPVLRQNGATLSDSVAIMTYLGDVHEALSFPAGSLERARQDALTQRMIDELDSALWIAARHSFILPEEMRVPEVKITLKWEFTRNLGFVSRELRGPFLMGEEFTIPDIVLTHCLRWSRRANFPEPPDILGAYLQQMETRPALQSVDALP